MGGLGYFRYILLISLVTFLFTVSPVIGDRYVSVDAVSGTGDGSFEKPWTLSDSLIQTLPSGEPIMVNGSSSTAYSGPFTINNKTILVGYNGTPLINSGSYAFIVKNSTWMDNFEVKSQSSGFLLSSGVSDIQLANISLHEISSSGISGAANNHNLNVSIRDTTSYKNTNAGIVLPPVENLTIDNITTILNTGGGVSLTGAYNFTLVDISSTGNMISAKNRPGLLLTDSGFGKIQGLTASGNYGGGLNLNNSSKIFISSSVLMDQSGGVDLFIDTQSHDISLDNLRIGDLNGANLSGSNLTGSFSFNTPHTPPATTGSFVGLNKYVNITRGNSGIFESLWMNYSSSDIPAGYPESNIRIMTTNGSVWYPVSSTLHPDQHSVSFNKSVDLREGTWIYGIFTNKANPSVLSVSPSFGSRDNATIEISISGSGFSDGLLVNLSNSTFNLTNSSEVTLTNSSYLTTTFDLTRLVSDNYSVHVKNPDQTESLESVIFLVYEPSCPSVIANFSSNLSSGIAPLTVLFTNSSTGGTIDHWFWDFGDNNTLSDSPEVVHSYMTPGLYTVNLTAWNSCGNSSSALQEIVVRSEPCPAVVANFSSNLSSGIAPLTLSFTNSSTGGTIDRWFWDFGDNNTFSDSPEVVHTYTTPGMYTVNLTAWNSCDNFSSALHEIVVSCEPCPAVVANFSSNLSSGIAPLTVSFTNSSTGGTIDSWFWEFGDSLTGNTSSINHTFTIPGSYLVNLTSRNSCGNSSRKSRLITVVDVPPSAPVITNITPSIGVNKSPVEINALIGENFVSGATVNLTRDGYANITGTNVTVVSPARISCSLPIMGAGVGNWTVEVKNPDGQRGRLINGFMITSALCPDMTTSFLSNIGSGTVPLTVRFNDTSSGGVIDVRNWNFGDNSPNETSQTLIHTFNRSGSFLVSLVTKNTCGNSGIATRQINVSSTPAPVTYTVNASADTGGKITPSGSISVSSGADLTFNISSDMGYYISDVLVDGVSAGAVSNHTFRNISDNHSIHASFRVYVGNYTINASAGSGGTISPSGVVIVPSGGDQRFTITPDVGQSVSDVQVDNVSIGPVTSYTFMNVTENRQISAFFSKIPGEYLINSSSNQWAKIIPSGNYLYPENSNQSFKMQAKPGSMLENLTVDSTRQDAIPYYTFTNLTNDHSIYVEGTPLPGQVLVFFNATPRWGSVPLDVKFTSLCLGDPSSFFWDFGDGETSSDQYPIHRYNSSGVYSVSLRASNQMSGGSGSWNKYITVNSGEVPEPTPTPVPERITPMFQCSPGNGTAPLSVSFTDMSSGNPISWLWDFGDGSTSRDRNPVHMYKSTGTYSVSLLAQNSEYSGTVTVNNAITVR